jgi:hypothetical protein
LDLVFLLFFSHPDLKSILYTIGGCDMDAVTKAEVEEVLLKIRQARADLIRVEQESGCDLRSVISKLDEVVRKLTSA